MKTVVLTALAGFALCLLDAPAGAAEANGVTLPDQRQAAGMALVLNGIGPRLYSFLRIPVYVAGLYLDRPSGDAEVILGSPAPKLIQMHALYAGGRNDIVEAWQTSLRDNCRAGCSLPQAQLAEFYALMTDVRAGDTHSFLFPPDRVEIAMNDRPLGTIQGGGFSRLLLSTWIGAAPPTQDLKRALLGQR